MSKNFYFKTLQEAKSLEKQTPESIHQFIENTDFFFKVLKVKFESGDPELIKQGLEEIQQMREILENNS